MKEKYNYSKAFDKASNSYNEEVIAVLKLISGTLFYQNGFILIAYLMWLSGAVDMLLAWWYGFIEVVKLLKDCKEKV
jgi:hypothetical protein